ncbi:MAG: tetratricopeptide repeat protein [Lachnospiraceae bacterium]|nr:tetratricopeptide repeat protein [Lachnospiraceae bacterium]
MKCYRCGARLSREDFCTNCGADVVKYKKIMRASNALYNEGLEKANVRDLSGAAACLRQCLKLNKANVEARNLLGLVYFETGEVVAALSEWVISTNVRPDKNVAQEYISILQSSQGKMEELNKTIKKYNQSLEYCQQDIKDKAVIQLKSLLSSNPKFVRARLLLALLYIDSDEALDPEKWINADRELKKCLQIDAGNTMAKRYLKEVDKMSRLAENDMNGAGGRNKEEGPRRFVSGAENLRGGFTPDTKGAGTLSAILYIFIGLLIGGLATFYLVLPARIQSAKAQVQQELKTVSEQLSAKSADMDSMQQQLTSLENQNKVLQAEVEQYVGTDGTLQTMEDLLVAANTYLTDPGNVTAVAEMLEKVDQEVSIDETSEAFRGVYQALLSLVGPSVASEYYNQAVKYYRNQDYETAATIFQKALIYEDTEYYDLSLYNLGNTYRKLGDTDKAIVYYQMVVDQFPDTDRAKQSQKALKELGAVE